MKCLGRSVEAANYETVIRHVTIRVTESDGMNLTRRGRWSREGPGKEQQGETGGGEACVIGLGGIDALAVSHSYDRITRVLLMLTPQATFSRYCSFTAAGYQRLHLALAFGLKFLVGTYVSIATCIIAPNAAHNESLVSSVAKTDSQSMPNK